jgi:hypothetical protein
VVTERERVEGVLAERAAKRLKLQEGEEEAKEKAMSQRPDRCAVG